VEQVVHKFAMFEEAEEADRAYYRALTPAERLSIMIDLIYPEGGDAAAARFERVYRIVKLGER
jgi:methylmalonyl-CoA mutase N-terminal domain/subunit